MEPWQRVTAYHERTKHHFNRYARSLGYMDWANQPDPFRRYEGAPAVKLDISSTPRQPNPSYDNLYAAGAVLAVPVTRASISSFFEYSLALSAWKQHKESRWALRVNPSSGNLHPTEGYLIAGPVDGVHDRGGVYHYAPKDHTLERRSEIGVTMWHELTAPFPAGTFFVALTSIHWREAWKYGERAYRYCQHDAGHALAALSIAAALHGWRAHWISYLGDNELSRLLGLDREGDFGDAEREAPDFLLAICPNPVASVDGQLNLNAIDDITKSAWFGHANRLSTEHADWPIIDETAANGIKPVTGVELGESNEAVGPPLEADRMGMSARQIIFQRRSALALDGRTTITARQFFLILDRVLPRRDLPPFHTLGPPVCVHLVLFIHRVTDLDPGLYILVRRPDALQPLRSAMDPSFDWSRPDGCPDSIPLYQLASGDARQLAAQLSCGQEIAADGVFACAMIAEFAAPLRTHGAWFYRRLHWEAGAIGQVLYLEAEAAGIHGTGIGCFFDDPTHELLGLRDTAYQTIYYFTMGGPKEDLRLMTWPPYPAKVGT